MSDAHFQNPLRRRITHSYRTRGGFKTVDLNVLGWGALIGVGLAAGAILALATAVPAQIAFPIGLGGPWALLLILDHFRWRNGRVHLCRDEMDPAAGALIVARLQEMGIAASYHEVTDDEEDGPDTQRGILCRQADAETVWRMMRPTSDASI